ncbi:hypothetical protein PAGU2196_16060 [Pseudomonas sp. PAGU 2196]|nr:hypothetical protein PAGU2196_16060 [Pseudomonas sp. PAGU 2196]
MAVTEIPVEVDIARFNLGAAVFKKTGGLGIDASTQKEQAGNTAPRGVREGGKHARKYPERMAKTTCSKHLLRYCDMLEQWPSII